MIENLETVDEITAATTDRIMTLLRKGASLEGVPSKNEKERKFVEAVAQPLEAFAKLVREKFQKAPDQNMIFDALHVMVGLHANEKDRTNGDPCVLHPLAVADDLVQKYEVIDAELCAAALMHDVIEDCSGTFAEESEDAHGVQVATTEGSRAYALREIGERFTLRVRTAVTGLTNPLDMKSAETFGEKNTQYKEKIRSIIEGGGDTFIVKWADFSQNGLRPENPPNPKQREKYRPALDLFEEKFENLSENHPLYPKCNAILAEITHARATIYADL